MKILKLIVCALTNKNIKGMTMHKIIEDYENSRFQFIKDNIKNLVGKRFTYDTFVYHLKDVYDLKLGYTKEELIREEQQQVSEPKSADFNICVWINDDWGYVDIYYLYDLKENIVVTEVAVSED